MRPSPAAVAPLVLFLLGCFTSGNAQADESGFQVAEAAHGVFVHQGQHVTFDHLQHTDIANIGFIVGSTCVAVIDSGGSIAVGNALAAAIRAHTPLPVCYVVNTHVHADHVLGNAAFRDSGAKFVGHRGLADEIAASREFFLRQYATDLGAQPSAESIIGPDLPVDGSMDLDLGGRTLRLSAHAAAHSHSDLTVYDTQTRTLFMGDLLFVDRIPALDGSLKGWLALLDELKDSSAVRAIPGHGPASVPWPQGGEAQHAYLAMLLEEVRAAIAAGRSMDEAAESIGTREQSRWLLHEQHHARNVIRAYTELEWE